MMIMKNINIKLLLSTILLAFTFNVYGASSILEEVIVTAQKKEENIQEVPISVSALTGEQITELGLDDLVEITQHIPGLQVNAWSPQLTIFNIRGVSQNNFVDNLEAPIAVYQDDSYIASMNALSGQIFDLERVEVLRGPQGTLFGRNATGGLIHYLSRTAKENEFNGYIKVDAGSFSKTSLEGAIGGSLSENIRARVAFRSLTADGYIEPDAAIPPVDKRAIGGADGRAMRLSLQADLGQSWQADFLFKYSDDNQVPTGGYVFENCANTDACPVDMHGRAITLPGVVSNNPHIHQNDTRGFLDREILNITAKFVGNLSEKMQLTSISNYLSVDKKYLEDGDAFPAPIVVFGQDAEITQLSQEVRLSGQSDNLDWQIGGYFLDFNLDGEALTIGAPNIALSIALAGAGTIANCVLPAASGAPCAKAGDTNPFDGRSDRFTDLTVHNISLFAQVDYHLSDSLVLTGGLRWSDDQKDIDWSAFFTSDDHTTRTLYAATQSNSGFNNSTVLNRFPDDSIDYSDIAIRLSLQKQFSEETQGFVSFNRGIKGGNWSLASNVSPSRFQHRPEILHSLEIGVKSQVSEILRANATLYYYDYKDYQNFVIIPTGAMSPNPQIGNSDAQATGAEVELFIAPSDHWDILLGLTASQSEIERIEAGATPITDAELPNAPNLSLNYLVRYELPFGASALVFQFDGVYYGDQFLEVTNGSGTLQEAYNVSNLSISYDFSEQTRLSIWAKNILDETYKLYSLDLGVLGATTYYAPPMTVGANLSYDF